MAVLAFSGPILGLFTADTATFDPAAFRSLGFVLFAIMVAWQCFDCADVVLSGALKGAGDTRFAMAWLLGTEWTLYVPGVAIAMVTFDGGILAAWWIQLAYIILLSTGLYVRWKRGKWMDIRVIG